MDHHQSSNTTDAETESKRLRRHFKFTNDDLEENRRGVLSKKQTERIAHYEQGGKLMVIIIGVLLLVFPIGFANFTISGIFNAFQDNFGFERAVWVWGLVIAVYAFFGLFLLAVGFAGIFLIVSQFLKIKPYKLIKVRGKARLEKGHGNRFRHTYYDLYIGEQQFDGDSTLNKVIFQGDEYIVYYLESNAEIMSVEKA